MASLKQLMSKSKREQLVLFVLFVLYIVIHVPTPMVLAKLIDTTLGNLVVIILAITLFMSTHPIVGITGLIVSYELIRRSSMATGTYDQRRYLMTETKKTMKMEEMNNDPNNTMLYPTLEEEVVASMVPMVDGPSQPTNVRPVLEKQNNATSLKDSGNMMLAQ